MHIKKKKWTGITLTKTAQKYFYNLIQKEKNIIGIKIEVKKSGCAGFRYQLSFLKTHHLKHESEFYIYENKYIKIYIPNKYMVWLDKTHIDYVTTDGINMYIKFINPIINKYCGCGDSFHITC
ncbi:iron-sulfur cluster assembly accessory protein [Buchnera aphidicola (Takecallis taiwana)]|uniref:iron-sulfur cluster assembly accessory protein n=1 Tax=Buchnera aphidicola TaxID=9 RepID=UPI0031B6A240